MSVCVSFACVFCVHVSVSMFIYTYTRILVYSYACMHVCMYVCTRVCGVMFLSVLQLTNSSVNKKSADYDYDAHKLTSVFGVGMVIAPTSDGADERIVCLD